MWEFPHRGIARFCYDKDPAIIYFKYDRFQHLTSIVKKDLSGAESSMGSFPGGPDENRARRAAMIARGRADLSVRR